MRIVLFVLGLISMLILAGLVYMTSTTSHVRTPPVQSVDTGVAQVVEGVEPVPPANIDDQSGPFKKDVFMCKNSAGVSIALALYETTERPSGQLQLHIITKASERVLYRAGYYINNERQSEVTHIRHPTEKRWIKYNVIESSEQYTALGHMLDVLGMDVQQFSTCFGKAFNRS